MGDRINKAFSADIEIKPDERAVVATITTAAVDRDGEVLVPQGCNTRDFEKNPVVFLGHDYYTLPIGKCAAIARTPDAIVAKTVFAARPDTLPAGEEWIPDTLFSLFQQGVVKGFSVGFLPIESRPATDRDVEKYGAGCRRVYSKWSLLEYSVAPIPANQEAVALAVSKGMVRATTATAIFGKDAVGDAKGPESEATEGEHLSAVVMDQAGDFHAGEVVGESVAEKPAPTAAKIPPLEEVASPTEAEPALPAAKRFAVFVRPPAPVAKRVNIVQVVSVAVQKARGRVYVPIEK